MNPRKPCRTWRRQESSCRHADVRRTCHGGAGAAIVGAGPSGCYAGDQRPKAGFGVDALNANRLKIRGEERAGSHPATDAGPLDSAARQDAERFERWLRTRAARLVGWAGWRATDDYETSLGARHGRPRLKLVDRAAMRAVAAASGGTP